MGEDVALAFAADVAQAVAGVRELAGTAQELAGTAKEAADSVAAITEPATAAADSAARLAAANDEAAAAAERLAGALKAAGDAAETTAGKTDAAAESGGRLGHSIGLAALGMGIAAAAAVKMAGDFQNSTTHLVTDAGESAKNLGMVQNGILAISTATATSAQDITNGMYHVESAGFHGAQGLSVLRVAAEGARIGGADLDTVSKSLTGTLNAYGMSSRNAATQTNMAKSMMMELIATVGAGDMRMQDLASSLGNVAPVAAAAKVSFADVGGALATMTGQNMSAQQATQDLRHTIMSLESPNKVAQKEMAGLGLSASDLSQNLGKRGLAATLQMVTQAAHQHAAAMGQTYTQAVYKAMGGTVGLTTALMLSGTRMGAFRGNIATVAAAAKNGGEMTAYWHKIQGTFNFKLEQAITATKNAGIAIGQWLLPAATQLMGIIAALAGWFSQNAWAAALLAGVISTVLSVAIGGKMITSIREGIKAFRDLKDVQLVQAAASKIAAGAQWLLNAAMDANPIVLIIIAIVALVAAFVLLWTHSAAFRKFWIGAWRDIEHAALSAWHFLDNDVIHPIEAGISWLVSWVEHHWRLLATILATVLLGPVGGLVVFLATHWSMVIRDVSHLVSVVTGWFRRLPGMILHALGNLGSVLWNAGIQLIEGFINGIASMGSAVGNALLGLLPGPVRKFASWLGLASPSKLFHDFGRNTLLGYINGIREMAPQVHQALSEVGGSIAAGGLGAAGGASALGAGAGGGYGGQVNVTVPLSVAFGPGTNGLNNPAFLQYVQTVLQEAVLRYAVNNPGNGLNSAWRFGG